MGSLPGRGRDEGAESEAQTPGSNHPPTPLLPGAHWSPGHPTQGWSFTQEAGRHNNEHALRDPVTCSPFRGPRSWLPRGARDATHQKNVIYGKF